uniref:Integrase zinc-binding and helicase domain-containing protein n=1 Tax=Moumouvirus sp. 'Monve' TaxID=1128131 RepID=H6WBF0_9VIRU|nr:integrase zinc-binding and helicase domain-containing protein [Moumouvirus Monve]
MVGRKKCVKFRGKNVYYTNIQDLSKKLNIPITQARKLINDDGRRIVIDSNNNTLLINIKKENFSGLLKTNFGIARIDNKKIINDTHILNKGVDIVKELGPNTEGKYLIKIILYITFMSPNPVNEDEILTNDKVDYVKIQNLLDEHRLEEREITSPYNGYNDEIPKFVKSEIRKYMKNIKKFGGQLIHYEFRIGSFYKNRRLKFKKGYVRELNNIYELTEWANIQYENNNNSNDTCAVKTISKRYPKLYWKIKKLETEHGVMVQDFLNFCQKYDIGYNIYNELGKKIYSYQGSDGTLNCIIYNNHIYPINGGKPKKYSKKEFKINFVDNSFNELKKILNTDKKLPSNIKIDYVKRKNKMDDIKDINIISFVLKDKKFICNDEYEECQEILTNMGYSEYIYDNIHVTNIPNLLEKILKVDDISSFIPEKELFKTSPLLWKCKNNIKPNRVITKNNKEVTEWLSTVDKNKCYSFCLYSLPYLIKFDYRKHKINVNPTKILDKNLYLAKPKYWTILMPKTKIYPGYFLSECKNIGIEFDLLEELETEIVPNYFRKIIKLMYDNMSAESFKSSMNIFMGTFERNDMQTYTYEYSGIFTKEAVKAQEGFYKKIGDHYLLFKESEQYLHVRDRIPIATQIKDMSRMIIYKKIKELGLKDDQIVQINTDSISYYGELPKGLNANDFSGWKKSDFKELGDIDNFVDENISVKNITNNNDKTRILHQQYAGSGKTTYIIDNLVPRLLKKGISFIVLTPTHKTLDEYRKNNINCDIMQKYVFNNTVPEEEYIIIDEIGFVDRGCHDLLYKINKTNKHFECFGDFNQLQPVGENIPLNQPHYLRYMFNNIHTDFINFRNNFTKEYYDNLINNKINAVNEVKHWSEKNMNKAEYILCFRHKTKDKYNKIMIKKLGFKSWCDVGVKIVCVTNKLIEEKVYNNKQFTISSFNDDDKKYTLKDDNGEEFIVTERRLHSNFEPAYAINIHQAQGMTLNSYYWASDDDNFINGNVAYTIISRLRQKLNFSLERELKKILQL